MQRVWDWSARSSSPTTRVRSSTSCTLHGIPYGVVINAGAYTHYSYAIHDAIHDIRIPCVEVHISNIYARDEFRSHSVLSPVCAGTIAGFGINGYFLALQALSEM